MVIVCPWLLYFKFLDNFSFLGTRSERAKVVGRPGDRAAVAGRKESFRPTDARAADQQNGQRPDEALRRLAALQHHRRNAARNLRTIRKDSVHSTDGGSGIILSCNKQ